MRFVHTIFNTSNVIYPHKLEAAVINLRIIYRYEIPENYTHWYLQDLQTFKDASLENQSLKQIKALK